VRCLGSPALTEGVRRLTTELIVEVPGKVMLCGEYHVLTCGARALAFALNTYLEVYVRYGTTVRESLTLHSNLWGEPRQIDASTARDDMLSTTVCELMPAGKHRVEEIRVTSQLNPQHGFGSSSALYLALTFIAYLQRRGGNLIVPPAKRWQLAGQAFELQKQSQGLASGYDVATQFVGGIVAYRSGGGQWPYRHTVQVFADEDLHRKLSEVVHLFIGGQGADTTTVMCDTQDWIDTQGHSSMITTTTALQRAFADTLHDLNNLRTLIEATAQWRRWFSASPHFPAPIEAALRTIRGRDRKWSWKTSGAGGEDALIVIGYREDITAVSACLVALGWHGFDYSIAQHGMQLRRV